MTEPHSIPRRSPTYELSAPSGKSSNYVRVSAKGVAFSRLSYIVQPNGNSVQPNSGRMGMKEENHWWIIAQSSVQSETGKLGIAVKGKPR